MKRNRMTLEARQFRVGFLVHDVSRLRRTLFDKALKPLGVTRSQWWVLAHLSRHSDRAMVQTELARVLDIGKVALGGILDRLEANGLVTRRPDLIDRRAKFIEMTPRGIDLLESLQRQATLANREMMKGFTPDEIEANEDFLHRLKLRLSELDEISRDRGVWFEPDDDVIPQPGVIVG